MKSYLVTMECCTLNQVEVEAKNQKEAKELAQQQVRGTCQGDTSVFYEIEEIT